MDKTQLMKLAMDLKRDARGSLLDLCEAVISYLQRPVDVSPVDAKKAYRAYMKDYMARRRAKKRDRSPKPRVEEMGEG